VGSEEGSDKGLEKKTRFMQRKNIIFMFFFPFRDIQQKLMCGGRAESVVSEIIFLFN